MADGTTTDVFYNGVPASEMHNPYGLAKLGVEQVKPIITRGILIDVAGYKAVETLPSGYEVTLADVRGALARQQMSESDIKPGDALLFNFGWWRLWPDPVRSNAPGPGVGREVAAWIVERKAAMVGSDATTDVAMAVHEEVTLKHGIFNLEWMRFEGLLADRRPRVPVRLHAASSQGRDRVARPSARDPLADNDLREIDEAASQIVVQGLGIPRRWSDSSTDEHASPGHGPRDVT